MGLTLAIWVDDVIAAPLASLTETTLPHVVAVACGKCTCAVVNLCYIAAPVADEIIIVYAVAVLIAYARRRSVCIIEEPQLHFHINIKHKYLYTITMAKNISNNAHYGSWYTCFEKRS